MNIELSNQELKDVYVEIGGPVIEEFYNILELEKENNKKYENYS